LNIGIFALISVKEMVYLKAVQKKSPLWLFLRRETIDQKTYLIKFRGSSAPLDPHMRPLYLNMLYRNFIKQVKFFVLSGNWFCVKVKFTL